MTADSTDIAVIGAGIVGIAVAYHLKKAAPDLDVALIDSGAPMALTSAQSGENYRNWWPHPVMKAFTDHSIDLMEELARETDNRLNMTRRGYVLATRATEIEAMQAELAYGYGDEYATHVRVHKMGNADAYEPPLHENWDTAPNGVDILRGAALIQRLFPYFDGELQTIIHIRRAGAVDGQQMGQIMLERFRVAGGKRRLAEVTDIDKTDDFKLTLRPSDGKGDNLRAARIVNAAGPFLGQIAAMLGSTLPITTVLQQKVAFEDTEGVIPRTMPFSIDLDDQLIDWADDEREHLAEDPDHAWLANIMPGAIHCRPDGGDNGTWIKIGWAYNETPSEPTREPILDDHFPEVVIRGTARLNPALKAYYGRLPRNRTHYGGYYTMTDENWPLIGPTDVDGCFVAGAMSGFGTMAACATGELLANWMLGRELPEYAEALSIRRMADPTLMAELHAQQSRGIL